MYKSRLQELCQKKAWRLPEYNVTKQGQDHNPRFEATVDVNGMSFQSQNPAKSSKEAQNDAAYLAFLHFTAPPLPDPDMQHFYKNLLQNYAQKRNVSRPVYSCEVEGPPHASRFRCKVTIDEKTYEGLEFFPTIKEAEHAAARVALSCLAPDAIEEVQEDSSLFKNLLQELTQKEGCPLPVYTTTRSGEAHASMFVSSVEVKGEAFTGQGARTKKQAEFLAAKVAYTKLKECKSKKVSTNITPAYHEQEVHVVSSSHSPTNVNAGTEQNLGSKSGSLLNSSSTLGADRQDDRVNATFMDHHSVQFPQPEMPTDWENSPSSPILSDHPLPEDNPSTANIPSNHWVTTNLVEDSMKQHVEMSSITCNRIIVRPRVPNMKFPAGSTVLPMSDNVWVAVKLASEPNQ
ncbi:double-stranded RNA-binding protein 1-like isoform X2 [Gossypium australe]|uniref:Double-stranded RNA-binding protein 1-like isoform X2 n=1 Tax=Gossypium australe TaxID=47621 RepID=A0A5B6X3L2_9ROSI|nr:double-stranded RNA-binding protein 1-like isoform X2 [Gossypium australe]